MCGNIAFDLVRAIRNNCTQVGNVAQHLTIILLQVVNIVRIITFIAWQVGKWDNPLIYILSVFKRLLSDK